jgi:hypothetical protein
MLFSFKYLFTAEGAENAEENRKENLGDLGIQGFNSSILQSLNPSILKSLNS